MTFAHNVRAVRKQKGLTLQALSERCGVSRSMLSQIERGEKNPTIQVACQIAAGLGVTLSELLGEHEPKEIIMIKKEERYVYCDEESGFERHLLSPVFPGQPIEFILNIIPPGQQSGVFPPHPKGTKEYIAVAAGTLRIVLGDHHYDLREGDSLYYDAACEHQLINTGQEECRYYLIIHSPASKT
ncbi:helix-turn-helix domain-containing protein [Geobacillus subterraneus]|uniref:helix-turn-helix domain-containing protein n=1 Tax=Geobacillus subterraneus TaxID=129338 RepID=UPI00160BB8F4